MDCYQLIPTLQFLFVTIREPSTAWMPRQNQADKQGNPVCQKQILPENETMSAQEILIEEIRRQPESVVREVLHYLKFLDRQHAQENWDDVLPSREAEQEKLDILDGK